MTDFTCSRRELLAWLAAGTAFAATARATAAASSALPGDSIYRLDVPLTDQNGQRLRLADLRGEPVLASMFYSSCDMVCPMIFETIAMALAKAGPAAKTRTRVLMVSFDPARDTVPVLKQLMQTRHLDERWALARADEGAARQVAAVLGVQYRRLASGEYNHSSSIALLDRDGRIAARSSMLGRADPALVQALQQQLVAGH